MCLIYYPPGGSVYTQRLDQDILDCVEKDICNYQKIGSILLCGDFNARVGTNPDFIPQDCNRYTPLFDNYPIDRDVLERYSPDKIIDSSDKGLLDLCIKDQLRILNGPTSWGHVRSLYLLHT